MDLHSLHYHEDIRVAVATIVVVVVVSVVVSCAFCTRTKSRPKIHPEKKQSTVRKPGWDISKHLLWREIGENFDSWRYPVPTWGIGDDLLSETYGSAREGLKVDKTDEFDLVLLFEIQGLNIQKAANSVIQITEEYVKEKFTFDISKYRINPPSVNIRISFEEKDPEFDAVGHIKSLRELYVVQESAHIPRQTVIDVDIVPGLLLSKDTVPDPTDWRETMRCPRYAVFKWYNNNQPPAARFPSLDPGFLWRVCSSGYEKHVLDVARGSRDQCYFITALRVLKHELREMKMDLNPEQLSTVVRSYFVKHVAFYCILYLCVMNKRELTGVREALAYLLDFLRVALEERRLPHFFHGNPYLVHMFPDYPMSDTALWYNLFADKTSDALLQAERSLRRLRDHYRIRQCLVAVVVYPEYSDTFRSYIQSGD